MAVQARRNLLLDRKKLVKLLDTVFSRYIRQRDKKCVTCGRTENLQAGHLFSRVAHSTRWDEVNTHCQCAGCNLSHEHNPYPYQTWFQLKYGMTAYHALYNQWHKTVRFSNNDLLVMIRFYEKKLGLSPTLPDAPQKPKKALKQPKRGTRKAGDRGLAIV